MSRRRRKKKQLITAFERQIAVLHNYRFEDPRHEEARQNLVRQYVVRDSLTGAQKHYVSVLVQILKKEKRIAHKHDHFYLYAIECGDVVKIGHSVNPQKRLIALQSANPEELTLRWTTRVGSTRVQAECFERRIRKDFEKFHIRGEWFKKEILEMLE